MSPLPQHYLALGLGRSASPAEVRAAYVRLVKAQYAMAAEPGPMQRRLHDLQQAYRCLSDPERRAAYDRLLIAVETRHQARITRVQRRLRRSDRRRSTPSRPRLTRSHALLLALSGGMLLAVGRMFAG